MTARVDTHRRLRLMRSLPHARRVLAIVFLAGVAALLMSQARHIEWREVFDVIRDMPASALLAAGALVVTSHAIYSAYDLLGRSWTRHRRPPSSGWAVWT